MFWKHGESMYEQSFRKYFQLLISSATRNFFDEKWHKVRVWIVE